MNAVQTLLRITAASARVLLAFALAYGATVVICLLAESGGSAVEGFCGHNAYFQIFLYFVLFVVALEWIAAKRRSRRRESVSEQ